MLQKLLNATGNDTNFDALYDLWVNLTGGSSYWFTGHYITATVILTLGLACGLVGNGLVALAALSKSNRRLPEMWILLNLCVVNILFSVVVIPVQIAGEFYSVIDVHSGRARCKLVPYFVHVISYAVCLALALHSTILFIASHFRRSLYQRLTLKVVVAAALCLWLVCLLICLPDVINYELTDTDYTGQGPKICVFQGRGSRSDILRLVFLLVLPFLAMAVVTGCALWRMKRAVSTRQMTYEGFSTFEPPSHKRTAILLLVLLLLFLVCWFPLDVFLLVTGGKDIMPMELFEVSQIFLVMNVLNPCIVPYVYIGLDRQVSAAIKTVCCGHRIRGPRVLYLKKRLHLIS